MQPLPASILPRKRARIPNPSPQPSGTRTEACLRSLLCRVATIQNILCRLAGIGCQQTHSCLCAPGSARVGLARSHHNNGPKRATGRVFLEACGRVRVCGGSKDKGYTEPEVDGKGWENQKETGEADGGGPKRQNRGTRWWARERPSARDACLGEA